MSSFCIYCGTNEGGGVWMLRTGSYSREWKVGGVKGVNATQREVRKGKLAIHEGFGTWCTPVCSHMGSKHAWAYVDKVIKTSKWNCNFHVERRQVKVYIVKKKRKHFKILFYHIWIKILKYWAAHLSYTWVWNALFFSHKKRPHTQLLHEWHHLLAVFPKCGL